MTTPMLDLELDRFGRDLLAAAAREPARRALVPVRMPSRRVAILVVLALLVGVPAAIAAIESIFFGNDLQVGAPPGFQIQGVTGPAVQVAGGTVDGEAWRAYAVRCGTGTASRASVVVVSPTGSRNSAACGAVPRGGGRVAPVLGPSTLYDGETTFIAAVVPSSVERVTFDLAGKVSTHRELTPVDVPEARQELGMDVRFVVLAVPGDQRVTGAEALDANGRVIGRCVENSRCEDVP